jgi:hypothetical protein
LLSGRLSASEAARALLASESLATGLTAAAGALPSGDRARLDALMPAVSWEMTKILTSGRYPDVPYDSPEYRAIIASGVRFTDKPGGPAA